VWWGGGVWWGGVLWGVTRKHYEQPDEGVTGEANLKVRKKKYEGSPKKTGQQTGNQKRNGPAKLDAEENGEMTATIIHGRPKYQKKKRVSAERLEINSTSKKVWAELCQRKKSGGETTMCPLVRLMSDINTEWKSL